MSEVRRIQREGEWWLNASDVAQTMLSLEDSVAEYDEYIPVVAMKATFRAIACQMMQAEAEPC